MGKCLRRATWTLEKFLGQRCGKRAEIRTWPFFPKLLDADQNKNMDTEMRINTGFLSFCLIQFFIMIGIKKKD